MIGTAIIEAIVQGKLMRLDTCPAGEEGGHVFAWSPGADDQLSALALDLCGVAALEAEIARLREQREADLREAFRAGADWFCELGAGPTDAALRPPLDEDDWTAAKLAEHTNPDTL